MKNLKVRTKLITGFLIVTALTLVVGVVGIVSLSSLNGSYTGAIDTHAKPLEDAGHVLASLHAVRAEVRAAIIFSGDAERVRTQETLVNEFMTTFETRLAAFEPTLVRDDTRQLYNEAMAAYNDQFVPGVRTLMANAESGEVSQAELAAFMVSDLKPAIDLVLANMEQCMTIKSGMLDTTSAAGADLADMMFVVLPVLIAVAAAISIVLGLYISGLISKPLAILTAFMKRAGGEGDIALSKDDESVIGKYAVIRDEIGQCIGATARFVGHITNISNLLGRVADGDLTNDVDLLSEKDVMGVSLKKMNDNLNDMFADINNASNQVSSGSVQIADGAQLLAQGATEQSATVEELSASVTEVNGQTKANASLADDAKKLGDDIKVNAERGNNQMEQMIKAVGEISDASTAIGKVIKIIDDIAFQTNILALNAAVEAARAGQHGKGFAVVADEVRSLAAKSAEAAKNTSELIATSIEKSEQGASISKETAESLSQIVNGIIQSSELVAKIAASSNEQSIAIGQIGEAIDQVSQVIQQNSATAEESAAASEQMSGQATLLQQLIARFRLRESKTGYAGASVPQRAAVAPVNSTTGIALSAAPGGKY